MGLTLKKPLENLRKKNWIGKSFEIGRIFFLSLSSFMENPQWVKKKLLKIQISKAIKKLMTLIM
jgi:hypothetical protein